MSRLPALYSILLRQLGVNTASYWRQLYLLESGCRIICVHIAIAYSQEADCVPHNNITRSGAPAERGHRAGDLRTAARLAARNRPTRARARDAGAGNPRACFGRA